MRLKVLMVSKTCISGAHHGKLLELARMGVDLTLIVPTKYGNQPLEIREAKEYKIRSLPCWLTPYNHFHFYPGRIGPLDVDLVHLEEEPWSLVTHQFLRLSVKSRKPAIFFTWQNIYKKYPPPFDFFERYSFTHASAAIAGSQEAAGNLRKRGFTGHVSLIPIGVDPEIYQKKECSGLRRQLRLEGAFVVGFFGRIVREKGIADLLRSLAMLPPRVVLLMVGEGPFKPEAEVLASQLGVSSRVRWVPAVPSLEVPEYMSLLDAFVLPSRTTPRWKEQFGRVLIEAMSCGIPPVGSDSGEIPNVIGDAGLIFPEGNVEALAAQLRTLGERPELVAQLGGKGRDRVAGNYTHRRLAEATLDLYERVLDRPEGRYSSSSAENTQLLR